MQVQRVRVGHATTTEQDHVHLQDATVYKADFHFFFFAFKLSDLVADKQHVFLHRINQCVFQHGINA
jgi:hypothetical protein